jgi:Branched-chain amino acid transport system / permease component
VFSVDTPLRLYYFALAVFAVAVWIVRGVGRSRTGRVLQALRDNEANVMAYGVNPTRAKLQAFAVSGWVAAVAGVLFVYHQAAFRSVSYDAYESVNVFVSTVIGGLGALSGGPIGALFSQGAQWLLPAPWSFLVVGVGVILVLTSLPGGLGGVVWGLRDRYLRSAARRHGVTSLAIDRTSDDPIAPPDALDAPVPAPGEGDGPTGRGAPSPGREASDTGDRDVMGSRS